MGYYTYYSLNAYEKNEVGDFYSIPDDLEAKIVKWEAENLEHIFSLDDKCFYDGLGRGCLKWYDHVEDMKIISKAFPDVWFVLGGEGEERGDNWILYIHNGKAERVDSHIEYDEPEDEDFSDMLRAGLI